MKLIIRELISLKFIKLMSLSVNMSFKLIRYWKNVKERKILERKKKNCKNISNFAKIKLLLKSKVNIEVRVK